MVHPLTEVAQWCHEVAQVSLKSLIIVVSASHIHSAGYVFSERSSSLWISLKIIIRQLCTQLLLLMGKI